MSYKSKNILVMCCEGFYQDHLINRLGQEFTICGIVRQHSKNNKRTLLRRIFQHKNPVNFINHILTRIKLRKYENNAQDFIRKLFQSRQTDTNVTADIPQIFSTDINNPEVVSFINAQKPDLICVNGTNLLRTPILELIDNIEFGIINLHTGLSPYSRGGNCNLYMLLEHKPELVGITVHHIDKGIDSGDIILSSRPKFEAGDNYEIIDAKCFHLGIEAMALACIQLFSGTSVRIRQWQKGKLFLNRTGYFYQPSDRLKVNKQLQSGLLTNYINNQDSTDKSVKTIGEFNYPEKETK